jgi:hypothetical protein
LNKKEAVNPKKKTHGTIKTRICKVQKSQTLGIVPGKQKEGLR